MGHSCGALLRGSLVTLVGLSCGRSLQDTLATLLWARFGDFLHNSQVSKTSGSYETSSKSHTERFVRDFLKNSNVKVCKTSVSYETSSETQTSKSAKRAFRTRLPPGSPIGAHTSSSPAKQFRDFTPSTQRPLTRQSQCHSDVHLHHNSQPHDFPRVPRKFARPHLQHAPKYCVCREMSSPPHLATTRLPEPATKMALPHLKACAKHCACHKKGKYRIMVASAKFAPHHTLGMTSARSKSLLELRLVTKAQLRSNGLKRQSQCHSQKHHPPHANPNVTAQKTANLTCGVNSSSTLHPLTFPHVSSLFHVLPKASPNVSAIAPHCGRLTTVAVAQTMSREQGSTPELTHSGKHTPPRKPHRFRIARRVGRFVLVVVDRGIALFEDLLQLGHLEKRSRGGGLVALVNRERVNSSGLSLIMSHNKFNMTLLDQLLNCAMIPMDLDGIAYYGEHPVA